MDNENLVGSFPKGQYQHHVHLIFTLASANMPYIANGGTLAGAALSRAHGTPSPYFCSHWCYEEPLPTLLMYEQRLAQTVH
jgi:hypothetical protein